MYRALRTFVNNEINELQFAVQLAEVVLRPGGLLVVEASTDHERNIVTKFVFRNSGSKNSDARNSYSWELVDRENSSLIFKKL